MEVIAKRLRELVLQVATTCEVVHRPEVIVLVNHQLDDGRTILHSRIRLDDLTLLEGESSILSRDLEKTHGSLNESLEKRRAAIHVGLSTIRTGSRITIRKVQQLALPVIDDVV